ncbi:mediator of RNA polymerase II transcription subunit 7a-like isoform X2 [Actinidia eriantha]|uniref:mediator of RNA polymerase II transcription subunit 7a-like isoform X2 n=1 Tax=Actinidia eriantha TaxID=165200 RepID=UPI0025867911|nr:mediator of RNA polymerase II transcription subunit 7a-like isoform X2 [Actinidia eriantha]
MVLQMRVHQLCLQVLRQGIGKLLNLNAFNLILQDLWCCLEEGCKWQQQLRTHLHRHITSCTRITPRTPSQLRSLLLLLKAHTSSLTDDLLPSLEEQGVRQLYPKGPNIDFKNELRSLNRELQLHILELTDVLIERPSQYARRVEEISLIFKNLHHLLNSLRPHQARATLIHILELQIQRRKQAVEDIKRRREEAQRLLKEALGTLDGH